MVQNILLLLLTATSMSACGEEDKPAYLDAEVPLDVYVSRFKDDAISIGRDIKYPDLAVKFGKTKDDQNKNRIGYCTHMGPLALIVIDEEFFNNSDDLTREALVYHEMGHCVLGRNHREDCRTTLTNILTGMGYILSCPYPESIMYPSLPAKAYKENREFYVQELFSGHN